MDSRLTELETRVAFQDDLLETLNRIVADQQRQMVLMQREIRILHDQIKSLSPSDLASNTEQEQERPPHY